MKPFETLSYGGQLRRLRRLAEKVLFAYDLNEPRLTAIQHQDNTTFRVDSTGGEQYVLRIHRPALRTREAVRSEVMWLEALRRDTNLVVPEAVPTRDGNLLTVTSVEGVPEPRICVLFHWIPGRFLDGGLTPTHLERVGEFMARIQLHGAQFSPPNGFVRGRLLNLTDKARASAARGISEEAARQQVNNHADEADAIHLVSEICSPEDGARVETLIRKGAEVQGLVGQGPDTFGLVHGDLHQENYFFHQGQIRAIDFDDCGYGFFLFDMAITLSEVNRRKNTSVLRESFLSGYRSVRFFSAEHLHFLDTFIALRDLQIMIWIIEMRNHPAFYDSWASSVKEMLQDIREFVDR